VLETLRSLTESPFWRYVLVRLLVCDVAETRSGDDILALVRRGDYAGSSFAFNVFEGELRNNGRMLLRHWISVRLIDVPPD
jgi:phage head maturation protease